MTFQELYDNPTLRYVVVEFNKGVDSTEMGFDRFCKAVMTVTNLDVADDYATIELTFDFASFEEYNKQHLLHNYYDACGNPTLAWYETKYYPENKKESYWFDMNDIVEDYFTLVK